MNRLHALDYGESDPPEYAMILEPRVDRSWGRYWHLRARVVCIDPRDRTPRNLRDEYQPMAAMELTCQMDDGASRPYALTVQADPVGKLDLRSAQRIVSTLQTVERGLERLTERFGYTDDLGVWVARVMDVCGIAVAVVQTKASPTGVYSDGEYRFIARADVPREIDAMVARGRTDIGAAA